MTSFRIVDKILKSRPMMEGAGVLLRRVFGFHEEGLFDPFLLLDHFGSDKKEDYIAGFPWHPHRGMETVTYMLEGRTEHADSLGNKGIIGSGDIQWMTAGSGIIHQEMPLPYDGTLRGFQLWVNLPAKYKMMKPRYQDIPAKAVPEVLPGKNARVKVIAGEFMGTYGPVEEIVADIGYLDVSLDENSELILDVNPDFTAVAFVFEGEGYFDAVGSTPVKIGEAVILKNGTKVKIMTKESKVRFLFLTGCPLKEPVAWRGPIVMNTEEELALAFYEYRTGNFTK